jgi:hypothetical protein
MRAHCCAAVLAAVLAFAPAANGAFPGANGKIAFDQDEGCFDESANVYVIDPAGGSASSLPPTAEKRLQPAWSPDGALLVYYEDGGISTSKPDGSEHHAIASPGFDEQPAWSPDGLRIALASFRADSFEQIWTMNADGSDSIQLTSGASQNTEPAWSPDGSRIAFTSTRDGDPEIFVMDADGSDQTQITANLVTDEAPNWSPDGSRIAFERAAEIWTMNPDGSAAVQLTSNSVPDLMPAWSPDGTRITFARGGATAIWTMDAAGGSQTPLTFQGDSCDEYPDWQPLPAVGYPRPRGASPMYLSLIPAFARCTAPNRTHGAPLSFGSCAPPAPAPSSATVGQRSIGFAILSARSGNPATTEDEADVRLRVSVSDVRATGSLADYGSAVEAHPTLRITDRDNTPHPGGPGAGTVVDVGLRFNVPCAPTADATVGSSCAVTTTADTLVPNTVKEGRRSVWELSSFDLNDGDEGVLERPGVFVP